MQKSIVFTAMLLGCVGQALAQGGALGDADKEYLTKDRRGAAYELASAKLAATKATRADVKGYAQKLVHDHEMYNAALDKLGKDAGVTLPTEPNEADKTRMVELEKLTGTTFDAAYIKEAVRINAEDKTEAEKEKSETKDPAIKAFLAKFADMDAEHERLAKALEKAGG